MSAFNAKNLSYNKQEPSFLRKLRAEHGGDRSNVQFARPKKERLKTGDGDEDEPTIVDEHGESLGKGEWEEMLKQEKVGGNECMGKQGGAADGNKKESSETPAKSMLASKEKQQVAEIGANKKRKVVKVVGEDTGSDEATKEHKLADADRDEKKDACSTVKKKTKKIKLSFDEPDDG